MIDVFYTRIQGELPTPVYHRYLEMIPAFLQDRNLKFRKWNDRYANLFGKILLIEGLQKYGYDASCLNQLTFNQYKRPFLFPEIDFNISHSGEIVLVAIGAGIRLGVDVEKIAPVDFEDFLEVMTPRQWKSIRSSPAPFKAFFNYWAMKESVIKADSRGLSIPLTEIHIDNDTVSYDDNRWHLKSLNLDDAYSCFLATNAADQTLQIHYKKYYE